MSTLLIINPYCRGGELNSAEIESTLAKLGDVETVKVGGEHAVNDKIALLGRQLDRVVVAGGDGTLNAALPSILTRGLPLGIIPCGTANDFARSLGVPDNPLDAAEVIVQNCIQRIDVGVINDNHFLNAAGVGLGPQLTKQLDRDKKKRLGVLAYLESLVKVFGERRSCYATLTVDGKVERLPFLQITVASGKHYGGGMTISDEVEMDDGLLHVLCVLPLTPVQLILRALRIKYGAVKDDEKLIYRKGRNITIHTRKTCDVTADGELVASTPIECSVLNRALKVFVPRDQEAVTNVNTTAIANSVADQKFDYAVNSALK